MEWGNEVIESIAKKLEERLSRFSGKTIEIKQDGFLKSRYSLKSLKYFVEYEILNMTDEENENYIKINLNQIYNIESGEDIIKLYLDNDTFVTLNIKR